MNKANADLRRHVSILGTPNESTWPGVSQLPDFKPAFPQWGGVDLAEAVDEIDTTGAELLHVRSSSEHSMQTLLTSSSVSPCVRLREPNVRYSVTAFLFFILLKQSLLIKPSGRRSTPGSMTW